MANHSIEPTRQKAAVIILGACALFPLDGLLAQSPSPAPAAAVTPTPAQGGLGPEAGRHRGIFQNLSPEDRQKLMQARRAALADPSVQSAKTEGDPRAFHQAVRAAMLRDDPSVAPILAKVRAGAERRGADGPSGQPGQPANHAQQGSGNSEMEKRIAFLPEDERSRLRRAYAAASSDPQFAAQRQQWMAASTAEAKAQAGKSYRAAVRNAMLRNDPSIAPILQKVQEHAAAEASVDPTVL